MSSPSPRQVAGTVLLLALLALYVWWKYLRLPAY